MRPSIYAPLCIALLLVGCGAKRIDASSKEQMEKSVAEVRASLPEKERAQFDAAIAALGMSQMKLEDLMSGSAENIQAKIRLSLDGKTAAEVITSGQAIIEERRAKEKKQAEIEIRDLNEKKRRAEDARTELAKFKVTKSRFYKTQSRFGRGEPVIELSLENGTSIAVSRAYFRGTISSPGRSVPWLRDTFSYSIPGGIEPGEAKELSLAPNMFSDWGKVDAPPDAVFTVEVIRLDGPNEKAVFDSNAFTDSDRKRLEALKKSFES